jgi:hypothetical protein
MVPVGAHTKLLEGRQTHTVWVRIRCRCGNDCLLCSLLGRGNESEIFIRRHEAVPVWSLAVFRFSWMIGRGSR